MKKTNQKAKAASGKSQKKASVSPLKGNSKFARQNKSNEKLSADAPHAEAPGTKKKVKDISEEELRQKQQRQIGDEKEFLDENPEERSSGTSEFLK